MSEYARWMEKAHVGTTWPPEHRDVAKITGTGTVGQTLTCPSPGTWTNSPSSYTYQWVRGYVPWTNVGTGSSYILVAGDSGSIIRCVVSAVNSAGTTVGPPSDPIRCA